MPKNKLRSDGPWTLLWADIAMMCGVELAAELRARHNARVRANDRRLHRPHIPPDAPLQKIGRKRRTP